MRRTTVIIGSGLAIFFISSLSRASLLFDFESPTYTTGNLAGQDGWTGGGSNAVVQNTVVLAGSQSAQLTADSAASHSASGAGFVNLTTATMLMRYESSPVGSVYADFALLNGASVYVLAGIERAGTGGVFPMFYWQNGATVVEVAGGAPNRTVTVTIAMDFTNQQYSVLFDDGISPVNSGTLAFATATSLAQAELGSLRLRGGAATRQGVIDNISIAPTPEPSSTALLCIGSSGLMAAYRRKKKGSQNRNE